MKQARDGVHKATLQNIDRIAFGGQAINVRGFNFGAAVAAQSPRAQLIAHDHQHVGLAVGLVR